MVASEELAKYFWSSFHRVGAMLILKNFSKSRKRNRLQNEREGLKKNDRLGKNVFMAVVGC